VFSPYYAWARRRGGGEPTNFCAVNAVLYGAGGKRWAMTERGAAALQRDATTLSIGPSSLHWDGATLTIELDEICVPIPRRLRGTIRLRPSALHERAYILDPAHLGGGEQHRWQPIAPRARVEVALDLPDGGWQGDGYFDSNSGDIPLERSFASWQWSRANLGEGAMVLYEPVARDGQTHCLALRFDGAGGVMAFTPPDIAALPRTRWRVPRSTRAEAATHVRQTLEDTPFYARSVLSTHLLGSELTAMHESLSLRRFSNGLVQAMLPFRMPRRAR